MTKSNFDIGILFAERPFQLHYNAEKTLNFFRDLQSAFPSSRYSFYQSLERAVFFMRYRTKDLYDVGRKCLFEVIASPIFYNETVLVERYINHGFNENRHSLSPRKVVILFSTKWMTVNGLKKIKRFYPMEKFVLVNVIYDEYHNTKLPETVENINVVYFQHFQVQNVVNWLSTYQN